MTKSWCQSAERFVKERSAFNAEYLKEKNKILDHRQEVLDAFSPVPKWLADIAEKEYKERLDAMTALQNEHKKLLLEKYKVIYLTDEQEFSNNKNYLDAVSRLKFSYNLQKIKIDNYYQSRYDTQSRYETSRQGFPEENDIIESIEHKQPTANAALPSINDKESYILLCGCDDNSIDW